MGPRGGGRGRCILMETRFTGNKAEDTLLFSFFFLLVLLILLLALFVKLSCRSKKWLIDYFEDNVKRLPNKKMLLYEDESYTFQEVDKRANQVANFALESGLKSGDVVTLIIQNEPAFIWTYLGKIWYHSYIKHMENNNVFLTLRSFYSWG